jgi:hypothetical protein
MEAQSGLRKCRSGLSSFFYNKLLEKTRKGYNLVSLLIVIVEETGHSYNAEKETHHPFYD